MIDPAVESEPRIPPGPRAHHLRQSLAWFNRPVRFMERGRRRYGPVFAARFGPNQRAVFVSDPDAIREIVRGDPAQLRMGDANGLFRPVVGSSSILVLDGDEHLRHRRLMLPAFRRNHVARFEQVIAGAVERRAAAWPLGGAFPIQPEMEAIAFETIAEMALGSTDGPRVTRLRALFGRMMDLCESPFTLLPYFRRELGGLSPYGRLRRVLRELDEIVYAEIEERRSRSETDLGEDLLSLLVRARGADGTPMTDREIRDELVTMLMAGQETTTSALSWSFERLARHPEVADRLVAELERGDDAYLDAVIKEVLRQRPPIPVMVRKLRAPFELGEYRCPSGWVLMPSIYLVHREPSVYPNPERFDPERFLVSPPPAHAWIPFGGGARRCLGANLAEFEMRVVLRTVLPMLKLATSEARGEPIRRQRFAFSPRHGASVAFASLRTEPRLDRPAPVRLPPGPRVPATVQTLRIARDPVGFLDRCAERYGGAVTIDLLGFGRTVWVTDPDLLKRVLASPDELSGGEANRVTEPIIGRRSIVNSDGIEHRDRRRRISPALRAGHVRRYEAMFARAAERELRGWPEGSEIALHPAIGRISMEVILRAMLGLRDPERREAIGAAVRDVAAMGNLAALDPAFRVDVGSLSPGGRFRRRIERLDGHLYAEIEGARIAGADDRDDVLSILARTRLEDGSLLPEREIRDELVGLIVAGQESTGAALAWAFDLLLRNPAVHARVIAEYRVGAHSFTDAAIQEALRLRPPVLAAGRIARREIEIGPWRVPAGTRLWAPMTLVQRSDDHHSEPDEFRPERFIGGKPRPMTWIPFGAGNRRCIGMSFALLEMRVVLQSVLASAFLRPLGKPERPRLNNAVMVPAGGMMVRFDGLRPLADDRWAERVARSRDECPEALDPLRSRRSPDAVDRARSAARQPPPRRTASPR